ncbi:MlaD family protein [Mycobacteroides abscessus]|uniref:MlaD family protein n=1 Tax=Mycobacteroides abscessus TaxID=36809 RepID=UPI0009A8A0BC|nr:MlaD family protein [Mycobacteroides abscessus]SLG56342.1 Mce family protein [Mycobacteroides abscessus subsp. abscessus]
MIRNLLSSLALISLMVSASIAIGRQGVQWSATGKDWNRVTLVARDANGLVIRSRVLLRGVPIGEVTAITSDAARVAVEFAYPPDVHVPIDSVFRIENLSALGETYLSIKPTRMDGPVLSDRQLLTADPGTVPGTIGELAITLTRLVAGLDAEKVNKIVDELSTGFSNVSAIPILAEFTQRLNALVETDKEQIRMLLAHTQTVLSKDGDLAPVLANLSTPMMTSFGTFRRLMETVITFLYYSGGNYPADIKNGTGAVLDRINTFEDEIAVNLYNLTEPLLPPLQAAASAMASIDVSRLLDASLDAIESPGAFTVHVVPSR